VLEAKDLRSCDALDQRDAFLVELLDKLRGVDVIGRVGGKRLDDAEAGALPASSVSRPLGQLPTDVVARMS
jgi:hypothetical protein